MFLVIWGSLVAGFMEKIFLPQRAQRAQRKRRERNHSSPKVAVSIVSGNLAFIGDGFCVEDFFTAEGAEGAEKEKREKSFKLNFCICAVCKPKYLQTSEE